jgi:hypothetical protein
MHERTVMNGPIIMTTALYQNLPFPGSTGESRKAVDAPFIPADMTDKQQRRFMKDQGNYATLKYFQGPGRKIRLPAIPRRSSLLR